MSGPEVEPASREDLETLAEWWVALAAEQREHGSHVLAAPNRETIHEVLAGHRFHGGVLVARLDGELAGFATFAVEDGSFALDASRGVLSNLYVRPERRRRGVGTALLEAVETRLAERGVDVLRLEAMAENEAARRFYRANGYEPHRVTMERPLTGSQAVTGERR